MAQAIKFNNNTFSDSIGIYDITQNKNLSDLNALLIYILESASWEYLCSENSNFTLSKPCLTKYESANDTSKKIYKFLTAGTYTASNSFYGSDPEPGVTKNAYKLNL